MNVFVKVSSYIIAMCWLSSVSANLSIDTWHTKNGAKVLYVNSPNIPMVDIQVIFEAGSSRDGKKWGLAYMTANMLSAGTKQYNENEVSDTFNRFGSEFSQSVDRDGSTFSLRTLTRDENYQPTIKMFTEVLTTPIFPSKIFQRKQQNLLELLKQKKTKPSSISSEMFWKSMYGSHPYAHSVAGNISTIKNIYSRDLKSFYRKYYVAKNSTISIVGALTKKQAKKLAEKITLPMKSGTKANRLPEVKASTKPVYKTHDFASSQTHYILGTTGVKRGNSDYYALFLGNHLLGGSGFASMLMDEVREKRGLAYGVQSYFIPMKYSGVFMISLSTKNSTAKKSDKIVRKTLKTFMQGNFTAKKLQEIKDNLIGGFPLRLDNNRKISSYISLIGFYNLPLTYLDDFPDKIAKLNKKEVLIAWNKIINRGIMTNVMVGKL